MTIAKEVYDLDLGYFDRTARTRKYLIDCDVRDPKNQEGREDVLPKTQWIYWGSSRNLRDSIKRARSMLKDQPHWAVRFVESATGKVLLEFNSITEMIRLV